MNDLDEILPYIKNQKCVFFFGAGLSNIAGCYIWKKLLKKMITDKSIRNDIKFKELENYDYPVIIEYCKKVFDDNGQIDTFKGYVREALSFSSKKYNNKYLPFVQKLKEIKPYPKLNLTTNFDNLLENTRLFDFKNFFYTLNKFIYKKGLEGLFHIHGSIEDFEKILLTLTQYNKRYGNPVFKKFIKEIAKNNSILFICYSLEKDFRDLLMEVNNSKIKHYLLVSNEKNLSEINLYQNLMNVKIIKYGRKADFIQIMSAWIDRNFNQPKLNLLDAGKDPSTI